MKCSLLGGLAVAAISATASADVVISFANFAANGFQFSQIAAPGQLTGTLTGVSVNAVLNSSVGFTYADDLCVYIDVLPLSTTGMVQIGGYSDLGAAQRYFWPSGGSDAVGTAVTGDITFLTPVNMSTPNLAIWLGNGYGAAGTSGNWTGSITLIGVTQVPTPGALALLALAGFVSRRRR